MVRYSFHVGLSHPLPDTDYRRFTTRATFFRRAAMDGLGKPSHKKAIDSNAGR
jgi:hypothetical protein